jgi:hypothetical protein
VLFVSGLIFPLTWFCFRRDLHIPIQRDLREPRGISVRTLIILLLVVYVAAYSVLRFAKAEVWTEDGQTYVIFPRDAVWAYYVFRSLSYLDSMVTGMRFHIGPHI